MNSINPLSSSVLLFYVFDTDGSQAASAQNLDTLGERHPLPPNIHRRHSLHFIFHLPAVRHTSGILPFSITHSASLPSTHLPSRSFLQRSGPRGLHGAGHQQRAACTNWFSCTVSTPGRQGLDYFCFLVFVLFDQVRIRAQQTIIWHFTWITQAININ